MWLCQLVALVDSALGFCIGGQSKQLWRWHTNIRNTTRRAPIVNAVGRRSQQDRSRLLGCTVASYAYTCRIGNCEREFRLARRQVCRMGRRAGPSDSGSGPARPRHDTSIQRGAGPPGDKCVCQFLGCTECMGPGDRDVHDVGGHGVVKPVPCRCDSTEGRRHVDGPHVRARGAGARVCDAAARWPVHGSGTCYGAVGGPRFYDQDTTPNAAVRGHVRRSVSGTECVDAECGLVALAPNASDEHGLDSKRHFSERQAPRQTCLQTRASHARYGPSASDRSCWRW